MDILNHFSKLYKSKQELALLEWTYLVMVIAAVVIAGIVALFNQALGVSILIVPVVAFVAMAMNVVAWALVKLAVEAFLPKRSDDKSTKAK